MIKSVFIIGISVVVMSFYLNSNDSSSRIFYYPFMLNSMKELLVMDSIHVYQKTKNDSSKLLSKFYISNRDELSVTHHYNFGLYGENTMTKIKYILFENLSIKKTITFDTIDAVYFPKNKIEFIYANHRIAQVVTISNNYMDTTIMDLVYNRNLIVYSRIKHSQFGQNTIERSEEEFIIEYYSNGKKTYFEND